MNRPQHSSLVTALSELSWSDVKRMAIHLDESIDLPLLNDIEREYPIEERLMYTMKAWLERDCEASWDKIVSALQRIGQNVLAKKIESKVAMQITAPCPPADRRPEGDQPVVSPPVKLQPSPELPFLHQESELSASLEPAFDHSCTDGQARKIDEKQHSIMQSITASSPVTLHGQTESGPPVVSPVELHPSPGPDSLHQLQPDTVIRTRLEPACAHSASVSQGRDSDQTRAQLTTEQETSDSDCPTVPQQDSEISGWRRERRQQISNVAIMAAIVGAALAAAESGDSAIPLVLTGTGLFAAMIAFGVTLSIGLGVPTGSRKLSVFVPVVVAVLVGAGTVRIASTTARTSATASRATVTIAMEAERSVFLFAVHGIGIITALGAVAFAVLITEAVLPVIVAMVAGAVTIGAGAGVMVASAVTSATAAIMTVAAAGAAAARGPAQAAEAQAAAAAAAVTALAVAVITAAVGAPVLKTAAVGLAAVVAAAAAAAVAVESPQPGRIAAAVTVGTVVVAETAVLTVALGAAAAAVSEVALALALAAGLAAAAAALAAIAAAAALKLGALVVAAVLTVLGAAGIATAAVIFGVIAAAAALGLPAAAAVLAAIVAIAVVALELASILNYYLQ